MKEHNYKDIPKGKTDYTLYAVKVLKGDWANRALGGINSGGFYVTSFDSHYLCCCGKSPSSNKALFNTMVDELASNMGRATQTYAEYKKERKSMEIDWSLAPEGATHHMPNSQLWTEAWLLIEGGQVNVWRSGKYYLANGHSIESLTELGLTAKPKSKPVYTQAMSDTGELPPIGSKFIDVELNLDEEVEAIAHDINLGRVIYKLGSTLQDSEYFGAIASECKPLTPPIQLIDGKAYQFDHLAGVIGLNGVYHDNKLYIGGDYVESSNCTNIKLLTVEG